jgi:deoxyhypusine synthase
MAALVLDAKRRAGGRSGVVIFGGGAPKNFLLQTEPQLQEILGVSEKGHDYFIQVTDARPDTGGLSGATPAEAVSWGKIDPDQLPDTVVCYVDSTVAMPLIASYVLAKCKPRKPRRLYQRLPEMVERLRAEYRGSELYARYWTQTAENDAKTEGKSGVRNDARAVKTPRKASKKPARRRVR